MKKIKLLTVIGICAIAVLALQSFINSSDKEELIKTTNINSEDLSGSWEVDAYHSKVNFSVTHLVISEVDGTFKVYSGDISINDNNLTAAQFNFEIDAASIDTGVEARDKHLRSDDFFNTDAYKTIGFKSTKVTKSGNNTYNVQGDLRIRNVTKPITFKLKYGGMAQDGYGNTKAGFKASAVINRFDYDLKWNALTEAGGATVGKKVNIDLNLQYKKVQ